MKLDNSSEHSEMDQETVKLASEDGQTFNTSLKAAKMSGTIKEMLDALGENVPTDVVPLANVSSKTLQKIIEWIDHWQDHPQPTSEEIRDKQAEKIDEWNGEFLNMELDDLYALIQASNFLDIPGLLWLTTREVAYMIKGKSPEEIRTFFRIENDWTAEELEQVQRENQWCEEK